MSNGEDPDAYTMSFGDHLDELRRRLLWALAAPLPVFIVAFFFAEHLVTIILQPLWDVLGAQDLPMEVQVLSPPEMIMTELKLSAIAAVIVTAPWILWQLWKFIAPGLYSKEQRFVHFLVPGSAVLTIAGVSLLYFVMLPLMLHVLVMFGQDIGKGPEISTQDRNDPIVSAWLAEERTVPIRTAVPTAPAHGELWLLVPQMELYAAQENADGVVEPVRVRPPLSARVKQVFRVSNAVNFTLVLMLGVVVAFQMPLVIVLLGWLGIATPEFLRSRRRYALAICGILSAILTPADATSMLIMLVPTYALYELGILLLVLAPASAVSQGRIWRFGRGSRTVRDEGKVHNPATGSEQAAETAQTDGPVPRSSPSSQPRTDQSERDDAP